MNYILKPHVTEKAYAGIHDEAKIANTYTFRVARDADSAHVKAMVEKQFDVSVINVRMINLPSKSRTFKGVAGRTSGRRKALVRLKVGQRIAAFDETTTKPTE
jgi:large subunit ribosomal protein L23